MATRSAKEKAVESALRKLNRVLTMKMDGPGVSVSLYGMGKLTYREYEKIRTCRNVPDANSELIAALHRRGPDILDILIEVLEEEEEANDHIIKKIKEVYNAEKIPQQPPPALPATKDLSAELLGNGEWPVSPSTSSSPGRSMEEGTDYDGKKAYKMTSKPRGMAVIINNRLFTCGMKERIGTDRDAEELTRLLIYLGFYTNRFDNLTGREMHRKLREVAKLDHSQSDCVLICVLTHGINGKLYSTDGDLIPVEDLTKYYNGVNCPSLIGKPKLFIIQACRGGKFDYGVESEATDFTDESEVKQLIEKKYDTIEEKALDDTENFFSSNGVEETDGKGDSQALPVEADFVIAYATVPGYVSWRNSEYGSWFIKAFVDRMIKLAGQEHFTDILIEVNRSVAEEFQSKGRNKQIPSPVIMLTKKLYFRPGLYS